MHFTTMISVLLLFLHGVHSAVIPNLSNIISELDSNPTIIGKCTAPNGEVYNVHRGPDRLPPSLIERSSYGTSSNTSPNPANLLKRYISWNPSNFPVNACGGSSFLNRSTPASPLVTDCQCLMEYYRTKYGHYKVQQGDQLNFAPIWCRTCKFGFHTKNILDAFIGNTDTFDVMRDAIAKYQYVFLWAHLNLHQLGSSLKTSRMSKLTRCFCVDGLTKLALKET